LGVAALFSPSDIALAGRLMRKQPILTITAVLALATGIFLATTGFTFLEAGIRAQLPFSGGDRFVLLDIRQEPQANRGRIEGERFRLLRQGVPAVQHLGAFAQHSQNLVLTSGEVRLIPAVAITPDTFSVLPYAPLLGRTLQTDDANRGALPVAVIRESLWRRDFSANAAVIGTTANLSGVPRVIVGVMPDTLEFPISPEMWLPLSDATGAHVFGVLPDREHLPLAQTQVNAVSEQFEREHSAAPKLRLRVMFFVDALSQGLEMLASAVVIVLVLVLVVVAANIANLVLARTLSRSSELAIRSALGASRARLVAQVFTEVLALGAVAAVLGLAASLMMLAWIERTLTDMPFWVDFSASPATIVFVVAITLLASAVGGAVPALRATRRDASTMLAASSRSIAPGFGMAGSVMIAAQVALSIAALHAASVVARGVAGYMEGTPTPIEAQVLTAQMFVPSDVDLPDAHAKVVTAVEQMSSVRSAALSTSLPRLSPPTVMTVVRADSGAPESAPRAAPVVAVSRRFFETLGSDVISGRPFVATDYAPSANPVAIVNQPFVQKFFSSENPVGRQLRVVESDTSGTGPWREIVGVVPDLGLSSGDSELAAGFYVPLRNEQAFHLLLAAATDPRPLAHSLSRTIAGADPRVQVRDVRALTDVGSEDRAVFAGIGGALTGLGGVALLLSVIGVYAMLSYAVTQRTREIAIRTALGAPRTGLLATLLGRAAVPFLIGTALGPLLGASLVAARGIFAFRLPADAGPWAVPLLCLIMLSAGALAALVPGRRALGINASDALRAE
jgi:putative ABC transport system permease protein